MTETTADTDIIEHLDFTPPCHHLDGACPNPAAYLVHGICGCTWGICTTCLTRMVVRSSYWIHTQCGNTRWGYGPWLNFVTLHPIRGIP